MTARRTRSGSLGSVARSSRSKAWVSRDRAGEVGVDLEALEVADDEQRRVLERLAVLVAAGGRRPRGPCACPCTPRRSGRASRRRRSRRRRRASRRPSRTRTTRRSGRLSVGAPTPSIRHRSMKWDCDAARSVVWTPFHLAANSEGVTVLSIAWTASGGLPCASRVTRLAARFRLAFALSIASRAKCASRAISARRSRSSSGSTPSGSTSRSNLLSNAFRAGLISSRESYRLCTV